MATTTAEAGATPAPKNVFARIIGILTAPGETYKSVVAHPRWLIPGLIAGVLIGCFTALPMTTPEGKQAYVDQQVRTVESFGFKVDDKMYDAYERSANFAGIMTAVFTPFSIFIGTLIVSAILFAVFNAAMGGTARFKQLYAVVVHSLFISSIGAIFNGIVNYMQGTMRSSIANVGALLPMLPEKSFITNLLGMVDIFTIWSVIVLSIGLGVLYRRKTSSIATGMFIVYAVFAICIAAYKARVGS
jgi:hypothetical protein